MSTRTLLAFALSGALGLAAPPAGADESASGDDVSAMATAPAAMLVLDGARDMAEPLDGTPRMAMVKAALADLIQHDRASRPFGLAAANHEDAASCQDFDLRLDVGALESHALVGGAESLEPRGRRSIDHALRSAAEALDYRERPATVVLLAGGPPQCLSVACSLSREMNADARDLTVHVIGLGLDEEATKRLSCVADNTGGRTYTAASVPELVMALRRTVEPAPVPPPPLLASDDTDAGEARDDEATATTDTTDEAPRHVAEVPEGDESLGIGGPMARTIDDIPVPEPRPGVHTVAATDPDATERAKLALVRASAAGLARPAAVWAAPSALPFVHEPQQDVAARLQVVSRATADGPPVGTDVAYELWRTGEAGDRTRVAASWDAAPVFDVDPGRYILLARHGAVQVQDEILIGRLGDHRHEVVLDAGYLRLASVAVDGGRPLESDLAYRVLTIPDRAGRHPGESGAPRLVADSDKAQPLLKLPPGRYDVRVRRGPIEDRAVVEVGAGETVRHVFDLDMGYLRLSGIAREGGEPLGDVSFAVETAPVSPGEEPVLLATSTGSDPVFKLPAGPHAVTARRGAASARIEVDVAAGDLTEATVNLEIGYLRVASRVKDTDEPVGGGVRYRIAALAAGSGGPDVLAGSENPTARFTLSAGDYVVTAQLGDWRAERRIALRPGEVREVELTFDSLTFAPEN